MSGTKNKKLLILGEGAEAIVEKINSNVVKKTRTQKKYRLPQLDIHLRKIRTRSEAKILQNLQKNNVLAPILKNSDDKKMIVEMEFIEGDKLRDVFGAKNLKQISMQLGITLANMHNLDIIHSDLTTSNIIFNNKTKKIFLIDFGLAYFSNRTEDKAVDLHLLKQALDSYHYKIADSAFNTIISAYMKGVKDKEVVARLTVVERRGRNKQQ